MGRENPIWILKQWNLLMSLRARFSPRFFQATKSSLTIFFLFVSILMGIYLRDREVFRKKLWWVKKKRDSCVYCANVKVTALLWTEFESSVWLVVLPSCQKLINWFLLFQYSQVYISEKRRNSWNFYYLLERAYVAVSCVRVSKLQIFCGPRKSSLNI